MCMNLLVVLITSLEVGRSLSLFAPCHWWPHICDLDLGKLRRSYWTVSVNFLIILITCIKIGGSLPWFASCYWRPRWYGQFCCLQKLKLLKLWWFDRTMSMNLLVVLITSLEVSRSLSLFAPCHWRPHISNLDLGKLRRSYWTVSVNFLIVLITCLKICWGFPISTSSDRRPIVANWNSLTLTKESCND